RESETLFARRSGCDRYPWGYDRTPKILLRTGEFGRRGEMAKTPRKSRGKRQHRRSRPPALGVNHCGGQFRNRVNQLPERDAPRTFWGMSRARFPRQRPRAGRLIPCHGVACDEHGLLRRLAGRRRFESGSHPPSATLLEPRNVALVLTSGSPFRWPEP